MKILMVEACNYLGPTHVGSHAYAAAFAKDGKEVMWIGTPLYVTNLFTNKRGTGEDARIRRSVWRKGGVRIDEKTIVYYPLTLFPVADRPLLRKRFSLDMTLRLTIPPLERILKRHGFLNPDILWLSQSRISHPMLSLARPDRIAYRISDNWAYFRNVPGSLLEAEEEIMKRADCVFATSQMLLEKAKAVGRDAIYLPNGVGESFFSGHLPEPEVLRPFSKPRVIYVGTIFSPWIDFDLIAKAASTWSRASFLLVGPTHRKTLPSYLPSNVYYLGVRPYTEIPALLKHCQAAIIPFEKNPLTQAASPVKLFEYLASGIPVISVRLAEIENSDPPAILVDGPGEFTSALGGILEGKLHWNAEKAISYARAQTWQARYRVIKAALGI